MLHPHESTKLNSLLGRVGWYWAISLIVTVLLAAIPTVINLLGGDDNVEHFLGDTQSYTARVDSVEPNGQCGSRVRRTRYRVEVSWVENQSTYQGSFSECGHAPPPGSSVAIWVADSGTVFGESPASTRTMSILTGAALGTIGLGLGLGLATMQRARRRLATVGYGPLSQAMPVDLVRGHRNSWRIHPHGSIPAIDKAQLMPILYSNGGSRPTNRVPRNAVGQWWFSMAQPIAGSKKQIALLQRGNERCWVQLKPRRRG